MGPGWENTGGGLLGGEFQVKYYKRGVGESPPQRGRPFGAQWLGGHNKAVVQTRETTGVEMQNTQRGETRKKQARSTKN